MALPPMFRCLRLALAIAALVVLALVWMTNVYNFMDGADGLAGGMAVAGFGTMALAADAGGDARAADVAILKVQPLGGVRACLALVEELGLPMVVSSALESSVGIAAGVALAAALPGIEFASGLATVSMFDGDVSATPLVPQAGTLPVARVAPDALTPAPDAVVARWLERLHLGGATTAGRQQGRCGHHRCQDTCAASAQST